VPADQTLSRQIRQARGPFCAMAGTYALGVLNDNFFKQAACLLAVAAGRQGLQGLAAVVFTVPWLLFSAHAGWLADRFSKRRVVILAKLLELVAMIVGGAGVLLINWPLVFVMLFVMSLQSTIFSPALNGSVPELYPASHVLKANATLKAATTAAILIGIVLAGLALSVKRVVFADLPLGRVLVAGGAVAAAAVGVVVSLRVPRRPPAGHDAPFPWRGAADTICELWRILRADWVLSLAVGADAAVWFVAACQVLVINVLGLQQFGLSELSTSFLVVAELAGVAVGGLAARRLAGGVGWVRVQVPGFLTLGAVLIAMLAVGAVPPTWQVHLGAWDPPLRVLLSAGLLAAAGIPGGLLLVPLEAFFQVRPAAGRRGRVIAAANFAGFSAIALGGAAAIPLTECMTPTHAFGVLGGFCILIGLVLWRAIGRRFRP
jgi:hypothetical protein